MIGLAITGLILGFIAGLGNDKSAERMSIDANLTFLEIVIPTIAIAFVIYSFTFGIGFGLMKGRLSIHVFIGRLQKNLHKTVVQRLTDMKMVGKLPALK